MAEGGVNRAAVEGIPQFSEEISRGLGEAYSELARAVEDLGDVSLRFSSELLRNDATFTIDVQMYRKLVQLASTIKTAAEQAEGRLDLIQMFEEGCDENIKLLPEDLTEKVMKELECPVCMEHMIPPITLCENGHNICGKCRPLIKKCPTCRQQLLHVRNVSLENITRSVQYPCCNQKTGCDEFYPLYEIKEHQNKCMYRYFKCPLANAPGVFCLWEGPLSEIRNHVDKNHKERITEAITLLSVFIRDFQPTYRYCRVIYALGEMFYQQFHVKEKDFYFVVQLVGPEETASEFKYELNIKSPEGVEKISVIQVTQSVKVNLEDICESGKCVKLHQDVINNFLDFEKNLRFELEISRIKDYK